MVKQGKVGWWCCSLTGASDCETAAGEPAPVSPDCRFSTCRESLPVFAIQPTPQEQQQVEDWLKVKFSFMLNQERQ